MSKHRERSSRRTDRVAVLAVLLFVLILIFELLLVSWLPRRLHSERLWSRELALQDMIEETDLLRAHLRGMRRKYNDKLQEGEGELVLSCLDDYVDYIRENLDHLALDQIQELSADLRYFDRCFRIWKLGDRHLPDEELDIRGWLVRRRREHLRHLRRSDLLLRTEGYDGS